MSEQHSFSEGRRGRGRPPRQATDPTWREELGLILRETRESSGASLEEVAEYLGRSESQIYRFENGSVVPPANVLVRLAIGLGIQQSRIDDILRLLADNGEGPTAMLFRREIEKAATVSLTERQQSTSVLRNSQKRHGWSPSQLSAVIKKNLPGTPGEWLSSRASVPYINAYLQGLEPVPTDISNLLEPPEEVSTERSPGGLSAQPLAPTARSFRSFFWTFDSSSLERKALAYASCLFVRPFLLYDLTMVAAAAMQQQRSIDLMARAAGRGPEGLTAAWKSMVEKLPIVSLGEGRYEWRADAIAARNEALRLWADPDLLEKCRQAFSKTLVDIVRQAIASDDARDLRALDPDRDSYEAAMLALGPQERTSVALEMMRYWHSRARYEAGLALLAPLRSSVQGPRAPSDPIVAQRGLIAGAEFARLAEAFDEGGVMLEAYQEALAREFSLGRTSSQNQDELRELSWRWRLERTILSSIQTERSNSRSELSMLSFDAATLRPESQTRALLERARAARMAGVLKEAVLCLALARRFFRRREKGLSSVDLWMAKRLSFELELERGALRLTQMIGRSGRAGALVTSAAHLEKAMADLEERAFQDADLPVEAQAKLLRLLSALCAQAGRCKEDQAAAVGSSIEHYRGVLGSLWAGVAYAALARVLLAKNCPDLAASWSSAAEASFAESGVPTPVGPREWLADIRTGPVTN